MNLLRTLERDRPNIGTLLGCYTLALEGKDLDSLMKIWPKMTSAHIEEVSASFRVVRTLRIGLDKRDLKASATGATVGCRRRDEMVSMTGNPWSVRRPRSSS